MDDIRKAARGTTNLSLAKKLGARALSLTLQSFRNQQDPYGAGWKATLRGGQILAKTGRLKNSIAMEATSSGFSVFTGVIYASVHQFGMTIIAKSAAYLMFQVNGRWAKKKSVQIPQRAFLPYDDLPDVWGIAFQKVLDDLLDSIFPKR